MSKIHYLILLIKLVIKAMLIKETFGKANKYLAKRLQQKNTEYGQYLLTVFC